MKRIVTFFFTLLVGVVVSSLNANSFAQSSSCVEVRHGNQYPVWDTWIGSVPTAIIEINNSVQNANLSAPTVSNGGSWGGPQFVVTSIGTRIADATLYVTQKSKDIKVFWDVTNCAYNGNGGCVGGTQGTHREVASYCATWCGDGQVNPGYEACDDGNENNGDGCSSSCQWEPVDCQVSDWSEWGSCNNGQQTRTRTITRNAANGGQACPSLSETQSCAYCGDGIKNNGEQCDGTDGVGANQSCSNSCTLINNPVNCSYTWGERSSCSNGVQTRNPIISVYPQNGGQACPQPESKSCNSCGNGVRDNNEQCDYSDTSHNGWGRDGCSNSCQPINNPRYKCSNYACIQDDGNGTYTTSNCDNACGTAPYCGDGVRNNGEVCDFNDGSHNNWGNSGCSNQCQQINNPVCQDPNAENNGQVGSCVYKYACNNNYQCVQQKGGQYSSSSCDNVCVAPAQADVQITKSVDRPTFPNTAGERITWTLTYKNNGPAAAENVVVVDILPESLRKVVSMTMNAGKIEAGGKYTWYLGTLQPGQGGTITIVSEYEGGKADNTDLTNVVSIATSTNGDNPNNNNGSATTKPYSNPTLVDVYVTKSVDRSTFPNTTGEIITWTLNYGNNGPATATGVVVVDIIPKELTYLLGSVDGSKYTFTTQAQSDGTTKVTWVFKNPLPVGTTGSFTVRTQYKGGYPDNKDIINAVAITATNDSNPNNNSDSEVTKPVSGSTPQADVQITKSVDRSTFPNTTGEIITWTLNYKNNGPAAVTNAVIIDELPSSMKFVSAVPVPVATGTMGLMQPGVKYGCYPLPNNPSQTICVDPGVITNGVKWNVGNLAVGQTGSITLTTKYLGGVANGSGIVNKVSITVNETETRYDNNSGSAVTTPYGSGTASLGNYVWIDKDKDGIQDADEVALSGVKVELYKITSCAADLGTPIMTTTTNASGYYLFTGLDAGSYKVKFILPNGYEFTTPNQGVDDALDSDAGLNGVTSCIELKEGENNLTVDAGVILEQLISCEGLTLSTTNASVGATITYNCVHKNATQATFTVTLSGSTTGVVSMTGFTGQFTLSTAGIYNAQCTLDNGITYKVATFTATGSGISCAYKKHLTNADVCAVKSALDPFVSQQLNLSGLISIPTPYPYCTTAQVADTNYQCVDAPAGSQIVTKDDMACMKSLTVTSGGGGGGGGGGGYNFCGDGAINASGEQCDDGNKVNGDGCSASCKGENTPPTPPTPTNPIPMNKSGYVTCGEIDPPSINKGEYMPFWWDLETEGDVVYRDDMTCPTTNNGTIILGMKDVDKQPVCTFDVVVNDESNPVNVKSFQAPCFDRDPTVSIGGAPLFDSYLRSYGPDSNTIKSFNRAKGVAYLVPSITNSLGKLGEYAIILSKIQYYTCQPNSSGNLVPTNHMVVSQNSYGYSAQCRFNFTVTDQYFVQNGSTLSNKTTTAYEPILKNFYGFDSIDPIIKNVISSSAYAQTSNLDYLIKKFVTKYKELATQPVASSYYKVKGSQEIYVNNEGGTVRLGLSDAFLRGTVIFPNATDLEIVGEVKGIAMIVAPKATVKITADNNIKNLDRPQEINGIYIVNDVDTDLAITNKNLSSQWTKDGRLVVKGIIITQNGNIPSIAESRRSTLKGWFNNGDETSKAEDIIEGAAFTVKTDPSFWTNLPPGANELMSALETYK